MKDKDLKRRMVGARETVKITRAMQLVSASKMTRADKRLTAVKAFDDDMKKIVERAGTENSPLSDGREVKHITYIVVAADKGLCGDYNHRILDFAKQRLESDGKENTVYPIGQMAREYFKKLGCGIRTKYIHLLQGALTEEMRSFAIDVADDFLSGKTDEVHLVYTAVGDSPARQVTCDEILLPFDKQKASDEDVLEYKEDIDGILKQYIWAKINVAVCSGDYAFQYKCMVAMQKATTNGEELVDELNREVNRLRQEKITSELMDSFSPQEERE